MRAAAGHVTLPAGESDAEHRRHVVTALVVDRPGTLNRVSGLLRARSFNIESLTVGATHQPGDIYYFDLRWYNTVRYYQLSQFIQSWIGYIHQTDIGVDGTETIIACLCLCTITHRIK